VTPDQEDRSMMTYLFKLPVTVPDGMVLVHNSVGPTRVLGSRGFRAWLEQPDSETLEVCCCGWASELGQHFRMKGKRRRSGYG